MDKITETRTVDVLVTTLGNPFSDEKSRAWIRKKLTAAGLPSNRCRSVITVVGGTNG
jgi:hypothetical protein